MSYPLPQLHYAFMHPFPDMEQFKAIKTIEELNWPTDEHLKFRDSELHKNPCSRGLYFYGAYQGNQVIGYALLNATRSKKHVYLDDLGVDPSGQGGGIGGQLLRFAVNDYFAKHAEAQSIWTRVHVENHRAANLYKHVGFLPDGGPPKDYGLGMVQTLELLRPAVASHSCSVL
jgi:ribosomal protein S18 acetylase RimI-like enzyme